MAETTERRVIVVINANDAVAQRIKDTVEAEGFTAVTARPEAAGSTPAEIQAFLRRHNARVVVFDIADPYGANWRLAQNLRYNEMISGSWRQVVVTTEDKQALEGQLGPTAALEVNAATFDPIAVLAAVNRAVLV